MRLGLFALFVFVVAVCPAQEPTPLPVAVAQSTTNPLRTEFHVRYVNGSNIYIDGGRNAGLTEGTVIILKQDPGKPSDSKDNKAIEPGIVAKLKIISVASTSAVCEVLVSSRELVTGDSVFLPKEEIQKIVDKDTIGNTRQYPIVISFSEGDPVDAEERLTVPRPPLPEVNQARGRIGFDISTIRQPGAGGSTSSTYGMVFRADFTRILGTHWNLNGYWRGSLQSNSAAAQTSIQDTINRTYLMSFSYINPDSRWTAGVGRLYLPWAASLETMDGAYVARKTSTNTVLGIFGGSTPDPTSWDYNPQRKIGGGFFNLHGGSFENFRYSSTAGVGVNTLNWTVDNPFFFAETDFSYKRYISMNYSMQIDKPTPNPSTPAVNFGLGRSLLSLRLQVHPRITLDMTHTYFRDVPTYNSVLVGTGLLDKYLYQGINGGARVQFPKHVTGYFSLGQSNSSNDKKSSLNELFGVTMTQIWKTGLTADVRYSKFDSSFSTGTYRSFILSKDVTDRIRLNLQAGRYAYTSSLATNSSSDFLNFLMDANLGSRMFFEGGYTAQRGGSLNYDQFTGTLGYRFNNRKGQRKTENAKHP
jgi:hypothetical protein